MALFWKNDGPSPQRFALVLSIALGLGIAGAVGQVLFTGYEAVRALRSDSAGRFRTAIPIEIKRADVRVKSLATGDEFEARARSKSAEIKFRSDDVVVWLWNRLLMLCATGVIIWVIVLLRRIVISLARGKPFARENVQRVGIIGAVICAWALVGPMLEFLLSRYALAHWSIVDVELEGVDWIDTELFLVGMLVGVLGHVFRRGAKLEEETALTV